MKHATLNRPQSGLSLIELMVAMTLGLMITMTLGYILMGSRSTYRTQDASARVQDTGRFVLDFIGRNIRAVGRVEITPLTEDKRITIGSVLNPNCNQLTSICGANSITTVSTGGSPTTRSVDDLTVIYQISDMGGNLIIDCNGNAAGTLLSQQKFAIPGTTPIKYYGNVINTLRLNPTNPGSFQLQCLGNGATAAQPFAEGVEDIQFSYGIDSNNDLAVDSWTATPGDWAQVIAVQACILVRSLENGVVSAPQTIVDCSGTSFTPNDTRLRRTFTSVFTLRSRINAIP